MATSTERRNERRPMFALYHYVRLHSGFRLASLLPLRVVLAERALNIHSLPLTMMNPGLSLLGVVLHTFNQLLCG
jgi:hypothetical protein